MVRRMLGVSEIVNSGLPFKSIVLEDGTIKLYIDQGISLNNIKYSISFTDPSQVTTVTGGTLQNL